MKYNRDWKLIGLLATLLMILLSLSVYFFVREKVEPLPPPVEVCAPPEEKNLGPKKEIVTIQPGDTLISALTRVKIESTEAHAIVESLRKIFNPKDLKPGFELHITYMIDEANECVHHLQKLYLRPSIETEITVDLDPDQGFVARKKTIELKREYREAHGKIYESLFADAGKAGVPIKILHTMFEAFKYDVDFQRSFQPGDDYEVLYEVFKDPDSDREEAGEFFFARLTLSEKTYTVFRFKPKGGDWGYYNEKGESVIKGLLRTPIDGARITSRFGKRHHPVLGYSKMHKGLDFGAPTGTPVMAAGAGVVEKAGWWGAYGNYIRIRHNKEYATAYAHLSRVAKGIRAGMKVKQSQIIGYVGTTGRSTGPHLHYEVIQFNKQVNPAKLRMLPQKKLGGQALHDFKVHRETLEGIYGNLRSTREKETEIDAEINQTDASDKPSQS